MGKVDDTRRRDEKKDDKMSAWAAYARTVSRSQGNSICSSPVAADEVRTASGGSAPSLHALSLAFPCHIMLWLLQ